MARAYRLQGEGLLYHITSRGDGRQDIFHNDVDCAKFLEYLQTVKDKNKIYVYAYCLMTNHYHLLVETSLPNISKALQQLNTAYTVYHNVKRKKVGHLFQGRFKSLIVDKDSYLKELTRYIHLNPVRAKIVSRPEKYHWSSYREYITKIEDGIIDKAMFFRYLKITPSGYKKYVLEGIDKEINPFKEVYGGFVLGKELFIKGILKQMRSQVESEEFAYKDKIMEEVDPKAIILAVAKKYNTSPDIVCRYSVKRKPLLARIVAIYLLKRYSSLTNKKIGEMFGLTDTAIGKAARSGERLIAQNKEAARGVGELISVFRV